MTANRPPWPPLPQPSESPADYIQAELKHAARSFFRDLARVCETAQEYDAAVAELLGKDSER